VFSPLQLEGCQAEVKIRDQVAVTTVQQTFRNPNARRLEGTFLFPVPPGAHLDQFALEIDGQPVAAELLDAEKARSIYQDIVRKARDPALLEYDGRDVFKVRVFPIEANSTRHITVRYTQLLKHDTGLVEYALPLNAAKYSSRPIHTFSLKIDLQTKEPIKTLYSPTHTVEIRHDGGRRATIGFEGSDLQPESDLVLYYGTDRDEVGLHLLSYRDRGEDGYFLLLASPGVDIAEDEIVPKDVAFVLDTSGSMAGKKLEQARRALKFCVENLNEEDRFEIIRFSTEAEALFGHLTTAKRSQRDRAIEFADDLKAIGGTAIDDALKRALALRADSVSHSESGRMDRGRPPIVDASRPFVVIFLTDGLPTVGVTSEDRILENVKDRSDGKVRVFCFGIGTDVNTHLLDKITESTRATSQYVLPEEDLEVKVSTFYSKIKDPVLANPSVRFAGGSRVLKMHPSELPDLFRGEQLVVMGRYDKPGRADVVLTGTVNGRQQAFERRVTLPRKDTENEFVPRLWANRRVGYLLDQIRLHGENAELKDEVVALAREYGIVTPYTAYLILEDEDQRRVPTAAQTLPRLNADPLIRQQIRRISLGAQQQVSGDLAVNAARANASSRAANSLAEAAASQQESQRALRYTTGPLTDLSREASSGAIPSGVPAPQISRCAGGRTFYFNDGRWVDAQVQNASTTEPIKLVFCSDAYFRFAAAHPEAGPWLAQGTRVEFVLNGTWYVIHEGQTGEAEDDSPSP
jgi:Ca-activated chloride channel family protein